MYQVGAVVVYENMGPCRIDNISSKSFPGEEEKRPYYTLSPVLKDCLLHTPVNSDKVFMRPIITRDAAEQLIGLIPTMDTAPCQKKPGREVTEHYTNLLHNYDCRDLLELILLIHAKQQGMEGTTRKPSTTDRRFLLHAEELLFSEFSIALSIPQEEVSDYIACRVR